jgi:hypothetical protein
MNSLLGSNFPCRRCNALRAAVTSGRPCLAARELFARNTGASARPHDHTNFALVHIFGSTPILTRTYQEATYLAEFCFKEGPLPMGLCWVHECPDDVSGAIDFAFQRGVDEMRAARCLAA